MVPDAEWRKAFVDASGEAGCTAVQADAEDYGNWNPGDNITLAVGQGDLLVTPLQLADAYAAFANGGTLWRPQLVEKIIDPSTTRSPQTIAPQALRHIATDPRRRCARRCSPGSAASVSDPKGTAYEAFNGVPVRAVPVSGKTGTAAGRCAGQEGLQVVNGVPTFEQCIGDTSWFVGMFAATQRSRTHPRYVVVVNVEQGGFGGRIAAPIAAPDHREDARLPQSRRSPTSPRRRPVHR